MSIFNITSAKVLLLNMALIGFSSNSFARPGGGEGRERGGPPQEAIQACEGLAENDACEFSGRRGSVSGNCFVPPEDVEILACKPANQDSRRGEDGEGD